MNQIKKAEDIQGKQMSARATEFIGTRGSRPIARRPHDAPNTFSFAQQRIWILNQLEEKGSVYNLSQAWRVTGLLDVDSLERSIRAVLTRHEALRTCFTGEQGTPTEVISSDESFNLPVVDLGEWPVREREMKAQQLMTEEACRPFDISHGPLIRALLLRVFPHQTAHESSLRISSAFGGQEYAEPAGDRWDSPGQAAAVQEDHR